MAVQTAEEYTLSYSEEAKGWPSFYSYIPDFMIGMNSYFYTFRNGNLYRHNTNVLRNNYYGVQYNSRITSVFNTEPQTIKLFKTMSYESDDAWACTALFTELSGGSMLDTYFVQKEREWFTFLRDNSTNVNFNLRSANGIGSCLLIGGIPGAFSISFNVDLGSIISIGDYIYAGANSLYFGQVTGIDQVNNVLTVDESVPDPIGQAGIIPPNGSYIFYYKNPVAESHGARGYFMQYTLENTNTQAVELFSVGSSVMKSYP